MSFGDIIVVEEGEMVAADARVVDRTALKMAEAALTGESLPVSKDVAAIAGDVGLGDRDNMIYSFTEDSRLELFTTRAHG
jgi:Ca2+-transporting ATPase